MPRRQREKSRWRLGWWCRLSPGYYTRAARYPHARPGGRAELRGCTSELAPATPAARDNCCDFSKQEHKLSLPVHELAAKILVPAPLLAIEAPTRRWPAALRAAGPADSTARWYAADSSPPPLGGRGLLAFVCTLVV